MAVIKKDGSSMGLPMNINRGNPIPIDTTSVWYSLAEAQAYATSGATAYVGQIISVVNENDQTTDMYLIINTNGDLLQINKTDSLVTEPESLTNEDIDAIIESVTN